MKALRTLMRDRVSGGITAALTGYLLVLQIFVAALTCGMTVPVEAGPQFVLCQPSQFSADGTAAETNTDDHGFVHVCPSVICHNDPVDFVALVPASAEIGPAHDAAYDQEQPVIVVDPALSIDPGRLGLAPAPRGPPSSNA